MFSDTKNLIELTLNSVGLVFFDPDVLENFVKKNNLSGDLFESFQQQPEVGDEAIKAGVLIPVYSIPPLDYQILLSEGHKPRINEEWIKFITPALPLVSTSGKVVVSDIDAIMDWDYSFYRSLEHTKLKQPYNAFMIDPGIFSVKIVGFCETKWTGSGPINKGYELLFDKTDTLLKVNENVDSDSINYIVYGEL